MKKVLIISYFFPPANFAGSYRIASWVKHLHKFGYYPVLITRCWNDNQSDSTDEVIDNKFQYEKTDQYEIYRLPFHNNLRDRLFQKYGDTKYVYLRRLLTFLALISQRYTNFFIPFSNLYDLAKKLVKKEGDFESVILSGNPYQLFKFGYLLHKKTGIKWIADYRDEWTTHPWDTNEGAYIKYIQRIESGCEKKWLQNASLFTTCSNGLINGIAPFIKKEGRVILNGFEDPISKMHETATPQWNVFTIIHNGTLYATQPIEIFLDGFKLFLAKNEGANIIIEFPGLDYIPAQAQRVQKRMSGYEKYIRISKRIPKPELLEMMAKSHLLLSIGIPGSKGIHSTKIFDYIASNKPILLCPSDKDVMQELIEETCTGYTANCSEEACNFLERSYRDFLEHKTITYTPNWDKISLFSRENQTLVLSKILDEVRLMK